MKRKLQLVCLLIVSVLVITGLQVNKGKDVWLQIGDDGMLCMKLVSDHSEKTLVATPIRQDGERVYNFFLPSYAMKNKVWYQEDKMEIYLNGDRVGTGGSLEWEDSEAYLVRFVDETGRGSQQASEQKVRFMRSENIPAVFIETESGKMDYLIESKENEEPGRIEVIMESGNTEYRGNLEKISGRGNSTWGWAKRPYSIKLESAQPLCGLDAGKKWNLLALAREDTKLSTKLAMDIGTLLELDYTPQGTWVDLYLNGEYAGNYLLTESVSVGEGRVEIHDLEKDNELLNPNIESAVPFVKNDMKGYRIQSGEDLSGGYLIEKDAFWFDERSNGFIAGNNHWFTVREPAHASEEQLKYMQNCIQEIEDVLHDPSGVYQDVIDEDSFVSRFLVDEITLNVDAYFTSAYFYKDRNDPLLYAGPLWDYDGAWGTMNIGNWGNLEHLIVDGIRGGSVDWFDLLYHKELYYEKVISKYTKILPGLEKMLEQDIDKYVEYIGSSVRMDEVRWSTLVTGDSGNYTTYENNIKYLKFFLASRVNYLNDRWEIPYRRFRAPSDDTVHTVSFYIDGKLIDEREISDGAVLDDVPSLDESIYDNWSFLDGTRVYLNDMQMPVYEDINFIAVSADNE